MEVKQGDIYWIDIPQHQTEGSEQFGRRPFVVMSRTGINNTAKTVIVVPMTTYNNQTQDQKLLDQQPPYRIVIPVYEMVKDASCNSALSTSVVKTDQSRVIDKCRLGPKIGRLSDLAILSVGAGLAYIFDYR